MNRSSWLPRSLLEWAALAAAALLLALASYALTSYALSREFGADVSAYWEAARRLSAGEPLYRPGAANASDLYRYSPWFAYLWIPLTAMPRELVTNLWVGLMVLAAAASTLPLLWRGPLGVAAFSLLAPLQLQGAMFGNVQPLLVLMLIWGLERRSGPIWVAVGASLKAVPLLLVVVWLARKEWRRAGLAIAITAGLTLPALLFDLAGYSTEPGPNQLSLAGVAGPLFVAVALASVVVTWRLARTEYRWVAAAVSMIAALPRLLTYEIGFALIGLVGERPSRDLAARRRFWA
jgi:hypothetical protein